jgi:uroporphyrinogen-III synthase
MANRRRRVWITRAQPGAEATAARVRALGHDAWVEPLLDIRPLADARIELGGVGALAFTSANGVRAFTDLSGQRDIKVFAVGAATAQAARAAGFRAVLSADGDVAALAQGIAARRGEIRGVVLHPGAAEPAGDLAGALADQGVEVRSVALYDSVAAEVEPARLAALVQADSVLLHSPKAAKELARVLKAHPAPGLRALGLSPAVIRPLARSGLAERTSPPMPLEAALLNLIGRGR